MANEWVLFALFSTAVWAIVNVIDKNVVSKKIKNLGTVLIFDGIGAIIASLVILFIFGIVVPEINILIISILSGLLWIPAGYLYYKALQKDEVSRVVPIFLTIPIFTAILAAVFLGEIFTLPIYLGIMLVVAGAILISIKISENFKFGKGFWFILGASLIITVESLMLKFALGSYDFQTVFYWNRIGVILGIIPVFLIYKKSFFNTIKTKLKYGGIVTFSNLISEVALIVFIFAMSLGPLTLVTTIGATQPLFVLIMAVGLSILFPHIIKENIEKKSVGIKLLAIGLMIVGSYLVAV